MTELGIDTDVRPVQFLNAWFGILVTLFPILTVDRDVQLLNTGNSQEPMVVQLVALKLTVVRPQELNARIPM